MARRSAKDKKAADVKLAENEAPKKVRGKAKNNEEEPEQDLPDVDLSEKVPVEKKKRGKKTQENGDAQTNVTEELAPPTKRGRKKAEPAPQEEKVANGNKSDEESNKADEEENIMQAENNDVVEETNSVASHKSKKKPTKKDEKPKESGRGKKAKQASPEIEETETVEEKLKGKGRGRKPKAEATKVEPEEDKTEPAEEVKQPAAKGKKKTKAAKEKTPESDKESVEEVKHAEVEKVEEKKETKGRKGKKAQAKDVDTEEPKEEPASKKRKVTKKEEKGKGDSKDEEEAMDEESQESQEKPKAKRGQKKVEPVVEAEDDASDAKRRRKPDDNAPTGDSKKKAPPKNKASTEYDDIDFSNSSKNSDGKEWNFKIASWNVDGIRAWMGKGGLDYLKYEKPDIMCLQEVKCSRDKLPDELASVPGYHAYWLCSDKDGYAGVGIYTTELAMNVQYGLQNEELDDEGRIITAEYEQFYLICTYVPNAGRKLITLPKRLQWNEEFRKHVKELDKKKPVIICGDMNVAHNEIDLANPKTNRKNAGFTDEERSGMTDLLGDGFVDTFRHIHPDKTGAYTFWTYMMNSRSKNVGWRLDYFIVSERLLPAVCDNVIQDKVYGSDHCPISLFLHLTSAEKPKE